VHTILRRVVYSSSAAPNTRPVDGFTGAGFFRRLVAGFDFVLIVTAPSRSFMVRFDTRPRLKRPYRVVVSSLLELFSPAPERGFFLVRGPKQKGLRPRKAVETRPSSHIMCRVVERCRLAFQAMRRSMCSYTGSNSAASDLDGRARNQQSEAFCLTFQKRSVSPVCDPLPSTLP
jgi:hypothetical protein